MYICFVNIDFKVSNKIILLCQYLFAKNFYILMLRYQEIKVKHTLSTYTSKMKLDALREQQRSILA